MMLTYLPFSNEVNSLLTGFSIGVVIMAVVFALITFFGPVKKTGKLKEVVEPDHTGVIEESTKAIKEPVIEAEANLKVEMLPVVPLSEVHIKSDASIVKIVETETESKPATYVNAPNFELNELNIEPQKAKAEEKIAISFKIENVGKVAGDYEATLKINNQVVNKRTFYLEAGEIQIVQLVGYEKKAGRYKVEVGNLEGAFIISEADIRINSINIDPAQITEGGYVNVTVSLTNGGGVTGKLLLELKMDGSIAATREIAVAPGINENVIFMLSDLTTGCHVVELAEFRADFTVEKKGA